MNAGTKMKLNDAVDMTMIRGREALTQIQPKGSFTVELCDKDGNVKYTEVFDNAAMNDGKNKLLDVMFNNVSAISTWYIGLMDASGFTAAPVTDTMSSHAGWTEFTAYTEAVRQTWSVGSAASQQITNAAPATFNINSSGSVRGIFVSSSSTKSGTTGTLWASALFSAAVPVANTDQIKITYTVQV